ncbi:MAG TPA: TolC family protein [Myxococcales bacterium]
MPCLLASALCAAAEFAPEELTVGDAVARALRDNPSVAAGEAQVRASQAAARARARAGLPRLSVGLQATVTNDPLAAFGMRLQERDVEAADFDPARLNSSDLLGSLGASAVVELPLFTGGRLSAASDAGQARAAAQAAQQVFRRRLLAVSVVSAYFRSQLTERQRRFSQQVLEDAKETERLVEARVRQELLPSSELARATAHRAQAEADLVAAEQRQADARDELVLLAGEGARTASLVSPVGTPSAPGPEPSAVERADVLAAREQERAAQAEADAARAAWWPQLGVKVQGGTLWGGGSALGAFATAGLGAQWDVYAPTRGAEIESAQSASTAASLSRRWLEAQARTEVERARRAVSSAQARIRAAEEALAAAQAARDLRRARHREGLLPLTELLDAEGAVTVAHSGLLEAQLAARLGWAKLELALGQPIDGVGP